MDHPAMTVSIQTAARMTDLSEPTIRKAVNTLKLPASRVGRLIRIRVVDLEEWVTRTPAHE